MLDIAARLGAAPPTLRLCMHDRYYWHEPCTRMWNDMIFCIHAQALDVRRATWSARLAGSLGDGFGAFPFWSGTESTLSWRNSLQTTSPVAHMIAGAPFPSHV